MTTPPAAPTSRPPRGSGEIRGTVRDAAGRPVAEACVMIAGDSPVHRDLAALTGADGTFAFRGLLPGTYRLLVNAAAGVATTEAAVAAVGRTRVDLSLAPPAARSDPPQASGSRSGHREDAGW